MISVAANGDAVDERQVHQGAQPRQRDPDHPGDRVAERQAATGGDHDDAQEQVDPAPGGVAGVDHEVAGGDRVVARAGEGGDAER